MFSDFLQKPIQWTISCKRKMMTLYPTVLKAYILPGSVVSIPSYIGLQLIFLNFVYTIVYVIRELILLIIQQTKIAKTAPRDCKRVKRNAQKSAIFLM